VEREVTRIGVFTAFSNGKFLRYLSETGNLVELARQPVERLQTLVAKFESADEVQLQPTVVDPTRGAIMALLVQTPTMKERIAQGGWIGYIILVLGVVGLLVALLQFLSLMRAGHGVARQQKQDKASLDNPLGRILSVYNGKLAQDVETLSLKLDEAILREVPRLRRCSDCWGPYPA
jgi:biopolymer transport protein ExbB